MKKNILCHAVFHGGLREQLFRGVPGIGGVLCRNGSDIGGGILSIFFCRRKHSRILGGGSDIFRKQGGGRNGV